MLEGFTHTHTTNSFKNLQVFLSLFHTACSRKNFESMVFLTFSSFPHLFLGGCHALIEPRQQHGLAPLAQGHLGQQPRQPAGIRRRATQQGTCRPEKSAENPYHQCHQCHSMAFNPENTEIHSELHLKPHDDNQYQHRSSHLLPRTPSPACTRHGTERAAASMLGLMASNVCSKMLASASMAGGPGGPGGQGGQGSSYGGV